MNIPYYTINMFELRYEEKLVHNRKDFKLQILKNMWWFFSMMNIFEHMYSIFLIHMNFFYIPEHFFDLREHINIFSSCILPKSIAEWK